MTVSTQQEIMEVGHLVFVFVQMLFSCTVTKSHNILSLSPSFSSFYFILHPTLLPPYLCFEQRALSKPSVHLLLSTK